MLVSRSRANPVSTTAEISFSPPSPPLASSPSPTAYAYLRASAWAPTLSSQREEALAFYQKHLAPVPYQWGGFFEDAVDAAKRPLRSRSQGCRMNVGLDRGD